jgi:hypothetical protein
MKIAKKLQGRWSQKNFQDKQKKNHSIERANPIIHQNFADDKEYIQKRAKKMVYRGCFAKKDELRFPC